MKQNQGKRFEYNFKKSVPPRMFCYRFKDGTANFTGTKNENVRFQAHNICDYLVFNGQKLFLIELKAHKGKSLPINCIRPTQIEELTKASSYEDVYCGILIYFLDVDRVFWLDIEMVNYFILSDTERKSIPIAYCEQNGIEVEIERKKVNILLKLDKLFK